MVNNTVCWFPLDGIDGAGSVTNGQKQKSLKSLVGTFQRFLSI
ncbi:MAG: hypothetical protein ACLRXU_10630 [Barnesiella intestinihominis]